MATARGFPPHYWLTGAVMLAVAFGVVSGMVAMYLVHGPDFEVILIAGLLGLLLYEYRKHLRFGRQGPPAQLRISPDGVGVRRDLGPVDLVPWAQISRVRVRLAGGGVYTIAVDRVSLPRVYTSADVIRFAFRATPRGLGQVVGQIRRHHQDVRVQGGLEGGIVA